MKVNWFKNRFLVKIYLLLLKTTEGREILKEIYNMETKKQEGGKNE